jgi:hypothetical protein
MNTSNPNPSAQARLDWTERDDGPLTAEAEHDGGFGTGRLAQYDDGRWNWQANSSVTRYGPSVGTSAITDTREEAEDAVARALPVLLAAARKLAVLS